ncbi:MAG TPA: protein-L-isoaspartate(D-aspartate) O-methyltransferase [bacterium]|nr:protein-L-isoaspartate(D-aspartate) O-methyltransferase [bacterium]
MPGESSEPAQRMVRLQIESRQVTDRRVLEAMRRVPRHLFIPSGGRAAAYEDRPVSIGHGQTISQPYIVAFMTELLELRGGERVLEIGTGSGYQAAILSELCARVFSVERIAPLAERARQTLQELGCRNVWIRVGDGSVGWVEEAPFDRIIAAAAAPSIPQALRDQLADNGVLVLPVGEMKGTQELVVARRIGSTVTVRESIGCRFVPLVGRGAFPDGPQADPSQTDQPGAGR